MKHARGFSVLEILITVVVVGIALIPLLLAFSSSARTVTGTRDHLSAVSFAQLALEELRGTAFRKPNRAGVAGAVKSLDEKIRELNEKGRVLEENGVTFERTVTLYPGSVASLPAGQPDLMVVEVHVEWKAPGARLLAAGREYRIFTTVGSATQP